MGIFQFEFIRNALYAALLASVACGIIGTYVVVRRLVSISGGIAHTAFGGIGLGYLLGVNPLFAVLPFTVLSALGIGVLNKNSKFSEDTLIGIFWSFGMALGIIFVGFSRGYAPDLFGYLFGNILTVTRADIVMMAVLDIVIIAVVAFYYRQFEASSFDEEFSKVRNLKTKFLYILLLVLIAVTVVVLIRVVGIILVIALLSIPAALSRQYTSELKKMIVLAIIFSAIFTVFGLFLSYLFNIASGATIVILLAAVMLVSSALKGFFAKLLNKRNK
ncbi:MAG: metal ABC transporter permease [Elusimicrobia bacterium]|nr:metal ABC transporter permease [Elusimicrobiota bacterium]